MKVRREPGKLWPWPRPKRTQEKRQGLVDRTAPHGMVRIGPDGNFHDDHVGPSRSKRNVGASEKQVRAAATRLGKKRKARGQAKSGKSGFGSPTTTRGAAQAMIRSRAKSPAGEPSRRTARAAGYNTKKMVTTSEKIKRISYPSAVSTPGSSTTFGKTISAMKKMKVSDIAKKRRSPRPTGRRS